MHVTTSQSNILKKNYIGADALNRKPDYKNPNKLIKPMLVKNGNYMQITEATEKNNDIIRNAHDTKLSKTLKRIQKKQPGKTSKLM